MSTKHMTGDPAARSAALVRPGSGTVRPFGTFGLDDDGSVLAVTLLAHDLGGLAA